jgi:hypothetical protein
MKPTNRSAPEAKIHHDPDADFKQRRGQIHNRRYLKKKLAAQKLNIDSLQDVVDQLNLILPGKGMGIPDFYFEKFARPDSKILQIAQ